MAHRGKSMVKYIFEFKAYLPIIIVLVVSTFDNAVASERCFGVEKVGQINTINGRFAHCKKGDIISAFVMSLKEAKHTLSLHEVNYFSLRKDEVGKACSFEHPVVFVGVTELEKTKITWFDCVYIGKERNGRFARNIQKQLNKMKK